MTVHHYIALPKEKQSDWERELNEIQIWNLDGYDEIRSKFENSFVYYLRCPHHRASYRELFMYIDRVIVNGERAELYTCLDGHELKPTKLDLNVIIDLDRKIFKSYMGEYSLSTKRLYDDLSERFSLMERRLTAIFK